MKIKKYSEAFLKKWKQILNERKGKESNFLFKCLVVLKIKKKFKQMKMKKCNFSCTSMLCNQIFFVFLLCCPSCYLNCKWFHTGRHVLLSLRWHKYGFERTFCSFLLFWDQFEGKATIPHGWCFQENSYIILVSWLDLKR